MRSPQRRLAFVTILLLGAPAAAADREDVLFSINQTTTFGNSVFVLGDIAERTRTNKVTPDELSGGTFTLTNTGSRGALFDTPIINQPQVAILGVGTVVKRPMVIRDDSGNEAIGLRSMVYLSLSYDHRLVDGADAARYLSTVKKRLEEGAFAAEVGL